MKKIPKTLILLLALVSLNAYAWTEGWHPKFDCKPAKVNEITGKDLIPFLNLFSDEVKWKAEYSKGAQIDLNNDGIYDYIIVIPWLGCGLAYSGFDIFFIVSSSEGERKIIYLEGYDVEISDLIEIDGKIYFKHSTWLGEFEKSFHNHWVYQIFSFNKSGEMQNANHKMSNLFPAVTIYYKNPRFKQIELTEADKVSIFNQTRPRYLVRIK
jgi:hypothetical protein